MLLGCFGVVWGVLVGLLGDFGVYWILCVLLGFWVLRIWVLDFYVLVLGLFVHLWVWLLGDSLLGLLGLWVSWVGCLCFNGFGLVLIGWMVFSLLVCFCFEYTVCLRVCLLGVGLGGVLIGIV